MPLGQSVVSNTYVPMLSKRRVQCASRACSLTLRVEIKPFIEDDLCCGARAVLAIVGENEDTPEHPFTRTQ